MALFSPSGPPSSSVTIFSARSTSMLTSLRQCAKLPTRSINSVAYFLTSGSVGFCRRIFMSCAFCGSARMAWMIGKENLPSVRSSHRPLFSE